MSKLYSEACERNAGAILMALSRVLPASAQVLEVGSGSGQHAVAFARHLPGVTWQTSDLPHTHASIEAWRNEAGLPNVLPPLLLDMRQPQWPACSYDAVFSANTLHIMPWPEVETLFAGAAGVLKPMGLLCVYGPFNYNGQFTSASNRQFDDMLRAQSPEQGIRDIEAVHALAARHLLVPETDEAMPANNRFLTWRLQRSG